jgi:hypothetical protein
MSFLIKDVFSCIEPLGFQKAHYKIPQMQCASVIKGTSGKVLCSRARVQNCCVYLEATDAVHGVRPVVLKMSEHMASNESPISLYLLIGDSSSVAHLNKGNALGTLNAWMGSFMYLIAS